MDVIKTFILALLCYTKIIICQDEINSNFLNELRKDLGEKLIGNIQNRNTDQPTRISTKNSNLLNRLQALEKLLSEGQFEESPERNQLSQRLDNMFPSNGRELKQNNDIVNYLKPIVPLLKKITIDGIPISQQVVENSPLSQLIEKSQPTNPLGDSLSISNSRNSGRIPDNTLVTQIPDMNKLLLEKLLLNQLLEKLSLKTNSYQVLNSPEHKQKRNEFSNIFSEITIQDPKPIEEIKSLETIPRVTKVLSYIIDSEENINPNEKLLLQLKNRINASDKNQIETKHKDSVTSQVTDSPLSSEIRFQELVLPIGPKKYLPVNRLKPKFGHKIKAVLGSPIPVFT